MRYQQLVLLATPCLLWIASACVSPQNDRAPARVELPTGQDFTRFQERFLEQLWRLDPDWALEVGYYRYKDQLVIPDQAHRERFLDFCRSMSAELKSIPHSTLSPVQQVDYKLVENFLVSSIWEIETFQDFRWNPAQYNIGSSIASLFEAQSLSLEEQLQAATAKLERAGRYYAAAHASIDNPTREHTDLAILQHSGLIQEWETVYLPKVNQSKLTDAEKKRFLTSVTEASQAVRKHVAWLEGLKGRLKGKKARSFRLDPALYRQKFIYELGSSYSPEEIYQKALLARDRTLDAMEKLADELYPRYSKQHTPPKDRLLKIRAVVAALSQKHPEPARFRETIAAQIPQLEAFVRAKDLLYLDPTKPLIVRDTPLYARGVAGASVDSPGPFDKAGETYYNITPLTDYSTEEAASYLREYNDYTLQVLNIHEAIPGHYTQLVHANKSPSLIKSLFGNTTMIEGWAVYAERMMLEEGYGQQSPELWFMYYKWHLRVILNTILDYEVHNKNLDEKAALAMLQGVGFQEAAEAREKWKRATLSQVQLASYFTGYTEIYGWREQLKAAKGKTFNLRQFHDEFLSFGSAPVKYIRDMMQIKLQASAD